MNDSDESEEILYSDELLKRAESGNIEAQCDLGECYRHGLGVPRDTNKAIAWHFKAAKSGLSDSELCLGYILEGRDNKSAFNWYRKSVHHGNSAGYLELAACYMHGTGVRKNLKESFFWFLKAAKLGDPSCQIRVAECYECGCGVKVDKQNAAYWYNKLAKQGEPLGQSSLASLLLKGEGVPKNEKKAVYWLKKSTKGDKNSVYLSLGNVLLGCCYRDGVGVKKSLVKAYQYFSVPSVVRQN